MNATTITRRIGNSKGIIIPTKILEKIGASIEGTSMTIQVNEDGSATLRTAKENDLFKCFEKYHDIWRKHGSNSIDEAENIKKEHDNKDFEV